MTRHRNAATLYADSEAFGDRDGLMRRLSRAGMQPNALDHEGFLRRRGIEEPAVPSLKETFLQFGSGAAAPPGPDAGERQAARRASLFARELALIDGAEPEMLAAWREHGRMGEGPGLRVRPAGAAGRLVAARIAAPACRGDHGGAPGGGESPAGGTGPAIGRSNKRNAGRPVTIKACSRHNAPRYQLTR